MECRDIVIVGIQPWDIEIGSNCKNIAMEMSKSNRVLYVNSPLDWVTAFKARKSPKVAKRIKIIKGKADSINPISDTLFEFYPRILTFPFNRIKVKWLFDLFNRLNAKQFSKEILRAVKKMGFKDYIIFNDSNMFLGKYFKEFLNYSAYIYYIRDNLVNSPYPYWNTHGKRIEPETIQLADVVVANSVYYSDYAVQFNPHSYMVGQGCDTSQFDDTYKKIDVASELEAIPNPIIGYVGNIAHIRLDIGLIIEIAKSKREWQLVLVGPEDVVFKASELHRLPNVHFLGAKPELRLPEFIKGFDICINPQKINQTTIGNYPRKIDEYLTMGKPVVAISTKAMEYFDQYVYLASNSAQYIELIERALQEDTKELQNIRRKYGLSHSWKNNVKEIWSALEKAQAMK